MAHVHAYAKNDEPIPGYRLVRLLGRGGYGEVWEASAPGGTRAALKIVQNLHDIKGRQEFKALELIKHLDHHQLMEVNAYWLLDGTGGIIPDEVRDQPNSPAPCTLVIASRLASKNLGQRLEECQADGQPGIPVAELLPYLRQVALALDYLNAPQHPLGSRLVSIQHRDVKPENILLAGGSAKVGDFGLAKVLEGAAAEIHRESTGLTLAYAAPEVLDNQITQWTDQYSLGVTYYKLRTGAFPFAANLPPYQLLQIRRNGRLDLSGLPEAERAVITRATLVVPETRFPTCLAMVQALEEACGLCKGEEDSSWIGAQRETVLVPEPVCEAAQELVPLAISDVVPREGPVSEEPAGGKAIQPAVAASVAVATQSREETRAAEVPVDSPQPLITTWGQRLRLAKKDVLIAVALVIAVVAIAFMIPSSLEKTVEDHLAEGRYVEALAAIESAEDRPATKDRLRDKVRTAWLARVDTELQAGHDTEAVQAFEELRKRFPDDREVAELHNKTRQLGRPQTGGAQAQGSDTPTPTADTSFSRQPEDQGSTAATVDPVIADCVQVLETIKNNQQTDALTLYTTILQPALERVQKQEADQDAACARHVATLHAAKARLIRDHLHVAWSFDRPPLEEALAAAQMARQLDPGNLHHAWDAGTILARMRADPKDLLAEAEAVIAADRSLSAGHALKGLASHESARRAKDLKERADLALKAIMACDEAIRLGTRSGAKIDPAELAGHYLSRSVNIVLLVDSGTNHGLVKEYLQQAIDDADKATRAGIPYPEEAWVALGKAHEDLAWLGPESPHYAEAVQAFTEAIRLRSDAETLLQRGRCHYRWARFGAGGDQKLKLAEDDLRQAIQSDKEQKLAEPHYWLAAVCRDQNRLEEAEQSLERCVAIARAQSSNDVGLFLAWQARVQVERAWQVLNKDPKHRAKAVAQAQKARTSAEEAARTDPVQTARAQWAIGQSWKLEGNLKKAEEAYEAGLKAEPLDIYDRIDLLVELASVISTGADLTQRDAALKQLREAGRHALKAVELAQDDPVRRYQAYQQAGLAYQKASTLGGHEADEHARLAADAFKKGQEALKQR